MPLNDKIATKACSVSNSASISWRMPEDKSNRGMPCRRGCRPPLDTKCCTTGHRYCCRLNYAWHSGTPAVHTPHAIHISHALAYTEYLVTPQCEHGRRIPCRTTWHCTCTIAVRSYHRPIASNTSVVTLPSTLSNIVNTIITKCEINWTYLILDFF